MNNQNQDPVLQLLREVRDKQDEIIARQDRNDKHMKQIQTDCKRSAMITGAVAGGVSGGLIATGIAFIRAKLGV